MAEKQIFVCGLQESGKTTFLAALWYLLGISDGGLKLTLDKLDGDDRYLNQIKNEWLSFTKVTRSSRGVKLRPEIFLKRSGQPFGKVVIPDFNGELFFSVWTNREMDVDLIESIGKTSGMCLVIKSNKNRKDFLIKDALFRGLASAEEEKKESAETIAHKGEDKTAGKTGEENVKKIVEWTAELTSHQVMYTQILQDVLDKVSKGKAYRLAILISAWDVVEKTPGFSNVTPQAWIKSQMPLLYQFLESNSGRFSVNWYGLSSQGGELNDPELKKVYPPEKRISILHDGIKSNDLTIPLEWLLED